MVYHPKHPIHYRCRLPTLGNTVSTLFSQTLSHLICLMHAPPPLIRKKEAIPALVYLIVEALALISMVVAVVLCNVAGISFSYSYSYSYSYLESSTGFFFLGAIYAIIAGKFSSYLLISFSCTLLKLH